MEQSSFSLSPPQSSVPAWIDYLGIPLLVIYIYFLGTDYLNNGWDTNFTGNLLVAATWAILIFPI
ncbi:MAG: hypothetical protein U5J63_16720 [Fodinibius sp.]|nr:hypothetical protein [Fodinibius sp.]